MKLIIKAIFLLCLNTFSIECALAQIQSQESMATSTSEYNLPPLKVVIDSVLKRNGMVRFRKNHVELVASKVKSETIYWTRNLGMIADTRYGTFNNSSLNSLEGTSTVFNSNTRQLNYGVGLYLKIPVFDLLNRKNQITAAKMELEESKSMVQFQEEEVRQTTIKFYQDLVIKQRLLQIKSESLANAKVNFQMVEKEFKNGIVSVSEYVRISGISTNMETDYEQAKSDYLVAKQILEDMAGFVFNVTPSK